MNHRHWASARYARAARRRSLTAHQSEKHGLHRYGTGKPILKFLHRKRGRTAILEVSLIPRNSRILIHDHRRAGHFADDDCEHALYDSDLPYDLAFVGDDTQAKYLKNR